MDQRAARRERLAAEPEWQAYLEVCTPLIQSMDNRIILPTAFSSIR